jgi:prevent-host-death family protein
MAALPITRFKARASEIIRGMRRNGRPIVITHRGKPIAVLLSPRDYDRRAEADPLRRGITEGLADVAAGRTISDAEFRRWARRRFGARLR